MMEEETLFENGNFADYWLGYPPGTNTFLSDDVGWQSLEVLLQEQRRREILEWNGKIYRDGDEELNDDAFEAMLRNESERGGGLTGGTPQLTRIRSALVGLGESALIWERRLLQKN